MSAAARGPTRTSRLPWPPSWRAFAESGKSTWACGCSTATTAGRCNLRRTGGCSMTVPQRVLDAVAEAESGIDQCQRPTARHLVRGRPPLGLGAQVDRTACARLQGRTPPDRPAPAPVRPQGGCDRRRAGPGPFTLARWKIRGLKMRVLAECPRVFMCRACLYRAPWPTAATGGRIGGRGA